MMREKRLLMVSVMVLCFAACGPFESLNPMYTDQDLVVDPTLVGGWVGGGKEEISLWFAAGQDQGYELIETAIDDDTHAPVQVKYSAHLAQLGEYAFLDIVPTNLPLEVRPDPHEIRLLGSETGSSKPQAFDPHLTKIDDLLYIDIAPAEQSANSTSPGAQSGKAEQEGEAFQVRLIPAHWFFKVSIEGDVLRLAYIDQDWFSNLSDDKKSLLGYVDVGGGVLTGPTEEIQTFILEHADDAAAFSQENTMEFRRMK